MMGTVKTIAFRSIRKKMLAVVLVPFLTACGIVVAMSLVHRDHQIKETENSAFMLVQSLASQQEQTIAATKQMLSMLAHLLEVQKLNKSACSKLFTEVKNQNPIYSIIAVILPDGNVLASSSPPVQGEVNISGEKHVKEAIATLDFAAGEYQVDKITGTPTIHYGYPVLDPGGKLVAVLSAGYRLDEYAHLIEKAQLPEGSEVTIGDHEGHRLFRFPENVAAPPGELLGSGFESITDRNEGTCQRTADDGTNRIYAFKRLRLRHGLPSYLTITVGIPKDAIMRPAYVEIVRNISILAFAAFVASFLAWLFGNLTFAGPIDRLVTAARRLGGGDKNARTNLPHTSDELGQLAEAFDSMASQLEIEEIERRQAQKALVESEKRYRAVVEDQLDLIIRYSPEGDVTFVNEAFSRYFGIKKEEYIGRTVLRLMPKSDRERAKLHIESLNAGQPVGIIEHRVVSANDETRWVQWVTRAIFDDREQIVEYQAVGRDMTDLRMAQQALKDSEEELLFLSSRLLTAQEEERKRIARELHDSIGSSLVAVKIGIENARARIASGEAKAEILDAPISWVQITLNEARKMMTDLRPSMLDDLGLIQAIGWYCRNFQAIHESIRVEKQIGALEEEIPENLKIIIFRIMQEALNNVAKYSGADCVRISLARRDSSIHLAVEDNGKGFDLEKARTERNSEGGLGLASMQERARFSGGSLVIESAAGLGTTVRASWQDIEGDLDE